MSQALTTSNERVGALEGGLLFLGERVVTPFLEK
jgi:hypothetical protein